MSRRAVLGVVAACVVGVGGSAGPAHGEPARGDSVALLPLDAQRSLEIYGQPVASELARGLIAGGVQVVVVGARMAVPEQARLIVDGTITLGKAGAVTISLRVRSALDGVVLETLAVTAPGLAKLDSAAAELSRRLMPVIRDRLPALPALSALPRSADDHDRVVAEPRKPRAPDPVVLVAVTDPHGTPDGARLRAALDTAVAGWVRAHHRRPDPLDPSKLEPRLAAAAAAGSALAIGFSIVDYAPDTAGLPMATARVRVQIADPGAVLFDRVVVTDTVLGEPGLGAPELAARVAREVLAILRPHIARSVTSW